MAMKSVFKDIENQKPWGYDDFKMTFLEVKPMDITQWYLHTDQYDPDYARDVDDRSYVSMPVLYQDMTTAMTACQASYQEHGHLTPTQI